PSSRCANLPQRSGPPSGCHRPAAVPRTRPRPPRSTSSSSGCSPGSGSSLTRPEHNACGSLISPGHREFRQGTHERSDMNGTSRIIVGGALVGSVLFAGAGMAAAQEDPSTTEPAPSEDGSVTITLSPEQVTRLCEKRLPRIEKRTTKLVERIQGDENTRGSADWLRARAAS